MGLVSLVLCHYGRTYRFYREKPSKLPLSWVTLQLNTRQCQHSSSYQIQPLPTGWGNSNVGLLISESYHTMAKPKRAKSLGNMNCTTRVPKRVAHMRSSTCWLQHTRHFYTKRNLRLSSNLNDGRSVPVLYQFPVIDSFAKVLVVDEGQRRKWGFIRRNGS